MGEIIHIPQNLDDDDVSAEPLAFGDPTLSRTSAASPISHTSETAGQLWELTSLLAMSKALSGELCVQARIQQALQILVLRHDVQRGMVVLLAEGTRELHIDASLGLSADDQRARYHIGEGVTGRVAATGRPVVVPQISQEPLFLNRAGRRRPASVEVTLVCVPILVSQKPVGTLNVDLPFEKDRNYNRALKFFGIVASMIGQAVKIHHLVDAERRRLLEENVHLRAELLERYDFSHLIGNSGPMRRVYEQVTQVAATNTTVMLRVESGTGKELIANAIQCNSPRKNGPFIKVNCAALPDDRIIQYKIRKLRIDCSRFRS